MNDTDMQFAVTDLRGGGTSVLRPDGRTQTGAFEQDMAMQLQTDMPGEPSRTVMKVQYGVSTTTTLKKMTLP